MESIYKYDIDHYYFNKTSAAVQIKSFFFCCVKNIVYYKKTIDIVFSLFRFL